MYTCSVCNKEFDEKHLGVIFKKTPQYDLCFNCLDLMMETAMRDSIEELGLR